MEAIAIHGNSYTFDKDYYGPFGAPKRAIIYDWSIRCYRWVVLQGCATPQDKVTPVDPDAQLTEEQLPQDRKDPRLLQAKRSQQLAQMVSAYLREHGPTGITRIYMDLHVGRDSMQRHLRANRDTLYTYYGTKRRVWGIKEAV